MSFTTPWTGALLQSKWLLAVCAFRQKFGAVASTLQVLDSQRMSHRPRHRQRADSQNPNRNATRYLPCCIVASLFDQYWEAGDLHSRVDSDTRCILSDLDRGGSSKPQDPQTFPSPDCRSTGSIPQPIPVSIPFDSWTTRNWRSLPQIRRRCTQSNQQTMSAEVRCTSIAIDCLHASQAPFARRRGDEKHAGCA